MGWLEEIQKRFKEQPLLYTVLLILGVIIIFLIARGARKKGVIVEKHYYRPKAKPESPPAEGKPAPPAEK